MVDPQERYMFYFVMFGMQSHFDFYYYAVLFDFSYSPFESNITGALKIARWTTTGWWFGYKNFLWARWLCLWLTLFRFVHLILALFQVKKISLFQRILLIYKTLNRCQWGRVQTHMAYSTVSFCPLTPDLEMKSKSTLVFVKGTETYQMSSWTITHWSNFSKLLK